LESSIQGANCQISKLKSEKSSLEGRLQRLRSTLSQEDAAKERSEKQISEAKELGSNITSLQRQAETTSADVCDAVRELQDLKSNLSEVAISISNETQQLTVESSGLWQWSISRAARARHSTRQLDAIKRATEALTNAQTKLPGLLPASCTKLLLTDSASQEKLVSSIVLEEIPKAF
jgi:chromosome segregation ATPase